MAHSHREQEEAYVVVAGSGRVLLDDEPHELRQWDVLRVAPEVVRASRPAPTASTSSPWAAPSPRRATASWAPPCGRRKKRDIARPWA